MEPTSDVSSVDPIVKRRKNSRFPQRWNRFTYSLNNPILFFDPDGLDVSVFEEENRALAAQQRR